ncbi:hypothetical protein L3049_04935 [Labilibaculum sp. DW002]|uniref:Outer membrane protein beta-barrel domain-containing protein n=1 Tax=Paralabilibaculum antarcticum TaxID=2912572 RepID=A0ABT5VPY0_9BACT|nr:hypothetical protein [Labilibaculum sp. DW002]MDE5417347.1 hypothetical protein [Labilibaculum sp. DW002]
MKNIILLFTLLVFVFNASLLHAQYSYEKPVQRETVNLDRKDKFELGFHYGPAWTTGDSKYFAKSGNSFSLDLGVHSNNFYFGSEFTLTSWRDFKDSNEASEMNFDDVNFLWLMHAKIFMGDGKVKPYFGLGTDLITIVLGILEPDDEDCCYDSYCDHYDDDRNYNAWIVPSVGIRWDMGPDVSGNIGLSANLSDNYDFIRLQVGIVF